MIKSITKLNWLLVLILGLCFVSPTAQAQGDMEPYQALCNFVNSAKMGSGMSWNYISSRMQTSIVDRCIQQIHATDPNFARRYSPSQLKYYILTQLSNPYSQLSTTFWKNFTQNIKINEWFLDNPIVTMDGENKAIVRTNTSTQYRLFHMVREGNAWKLDEEVVNR
ncbi:hypothetical protein IJT10_03535 [bacterium]|nr:hypothetical protein [bacterium]